jgi:hypothetical protein
MHDLQSKPTKNTHVVDLSKKQTIGKEVVEHILRGRLPTTQKLSRKWVLHTCIHTHTHTHTSSFAITFIASLSIMVSSHVLDMASIVP